MEQPGPYSGAEPGGAQIQGYGDVDPLTGLHDWYELPQARQGRGGPTWTQLLEVWALIEADLHEVYGVDVGDEQLLRDRSWAWLRVRILGLLSTQGRLFRHFTPTPEGS